MSIKPVPAQPVSGSTIRQRMREALITAMKSRDRLSAGALRSALAAIDNAEAVEVTAPADQRLAIEQTPVGVGAADVARRTLTEAQVEQIVHAEATTREAAAREYDAVGKPERAELLRAEAHVLLAHLADHTGRP